MTLVYKQIIVAVDGSKRVGMGFQKGDGDYRPK